MNEMESQLLNMNGVVRYQTTAPPGIKGKRRSITQMHKGLIAQSAEITGKAKDLMIDKALLLNPSDKLS